MGEVKYEIQVGKKIKLVVTFIDDKSLMDGKSLLHNQLSYIILCYKDDKLIASGNDTVTVLVGDINPSKLEKRTELMSTLHGYESAFELAIKSICDTIKLVTGRRTICRRV